MRSACSASCRTRFDLLAERLHLAEGLAFGLPLGPHGVGLGAQVGQLLAQLLQARLLAGSFSLARAASSISSRMTRRVSSSSSAGMESISVRSMAHASSTRSMALSGRNRSVM